MAIRSKRIIWKYHYLNRHNPATFLNGTESVIAAGYRVKDRHQAGSIGSQNAKALKADIDAWLTDHGLSDQNLKIRMLKLLDAKTTKTITMKGRVRQGSLPPNVRVLMETEEGGTPAAEGEPETSGEINTLVAVDMDALETQRRTLDMAFKAKGLYAPEKFEVSGPDGGPIPLAAMPPKPKDIYEWVKWVEEYELQMAKHDSNVVDVTPNPVPVRV